MPEKKVGRKKRGNPWFNGTSWMFYYSDSNKQRKYKSGFKSKEEATEHKDILTLQIKLGLLKPDDSLKCSDHLISWYEEHRRPSLSPASQQAYSNALYNYIVPFMGKRKLLKVTRTTVKALYNDACSKSPSVARLVKTIVNQGFQAAIEKKLLLANPAQKVKLPIPPPKRKHVSFTDEQIALLIEASKDTPLHLPILLAVTLGCRKSELYGLKFSDFDYERKKVRVERILARGVYSEEEYMERKANKTLTKSEKIVKTENSDREISVPDFVLAEVRKQQANYSAMMASRGIVNCNDGYVIYNRDGQGMSPSAYYHRYKQLLQDAGLPGIRWHDLRHINASFYYEKGISSKAISKNLGHARNVVTVEHYIDTTPSERKAVDIASNFIDALFTPASSSDLSDTGEGSTHGGLIAV